MGAQKMGYFSRGEFTSGFAALGANSIAQIKKALPSLEAAVRQPAALAEFYAYSFRFCLTVSGGLR